jgi:hypothetical protein
MFLLTSCATTYKYSHQTNKEQLVLQVDEDPAYFDQGSLLAQKFDPKQVTRGVFLAIPFIGQAISYASNSVKNLIMSDKTRYYAKYGAGKSQLFFYNTISTNSFLDPTGMQFKGFKLIRTIETRDHKRDTALYASFSVDIANPYEIVNNSSFRLKLDSINIKYAKAKIAGVHYFLPWKWFKKNPHTFNMDIQVAIQSSWITEQTQVHNNESLGNFSLSLRNIPLDPASKGYRKYFENLKDTVLSGSCFLVPRSYANLKGNEAAYTKCWSQGQYEISANVNEAGKPGMVTQVPNSYDFIMNQFQFYLMNQVIPRMKFQ